MSQPLPVTVAIPVKNEEANLSRCLERLRRFADVVVIDSGSTDNTCSIAADFGARVLQFIWNGQFPKKRNWFLMNESIATPWVLFLDADEYVDDAFCDELSFATMRDDVDGFWLTYTNHFLGRRLRHGVVQKKLALFRVGRGLYERIDEQAWSSLDMEIHEHPIIEGALAEISSPIDHQDYKGLAHFIAKHRDYALWEANRFVMLRAEEGSLDHLTSRQRFKYKNLHRWWFPYFYFVLAFVVKRGFLDGGAGFHYAAYKLWYFHTIRLLVRELSGQTS